MESKCGFCNATLEDGALIEFVRPVVHASRQNLGVSAAVVSCPACKAVLGAFKLSG